MKAIIAAEAQTSKARSGKAVVAPLVSRAPSGGDGSPASWREQMSTTRPAAVDIERSKSSPQNGQHFASTGSAWRVPQAHGSQASSIPSTPIMNPVDKGPSASFVPRGKTEKLRVVPSPSGSPHFSPAMSQRQTSSQPGLGPVFTPTRQQPSSQSSSPSHIRRVGYVLFSSCILQYTELDFRSGSVWTLPPVQPVVQPSAPTSGISLVAIQQLELEQHNAPIKDKRSLKEIQEEERARQQEEDFLKWWAAEEARLQAEEQSVLDAAAAPSKSKRSKPKKPKTPKPETAAREGDAKEPAPRSRRKGPQPTATQQ